MVSASEGPRADAHVNCDGLRDERAIWKEDGFDFLLIEQDLQLCELALGAARAILASALSRDLLDYLA